MSGSFSNEGGNLVIKEGGRTVFTTAGKLVNLLPDSYNFQKTVSVAFPQVSKTKAYRHAWIVRYLTGSGQWGRGSEGAAFVAAKPQEYSSITVLGEAPANVNFNELFVRMRRTKAPSHAWNGAAIEVMPVLEQWIPFSGSALLETALGFARAFSIYIADGNLVLHKQQSVVAAPGGFGAHQNRSESGLSRWGTEWTGDPDQGIPVWIGGSGSVVNYTDTKPDSPIGPTPLRTAAFGMPGAAQITDVTDYRSTWEFDIVAKYGRRS